MRKLTEINNVNLQSINTTKNLLKIDLVWNSIAMGLSGSSENHEKFKCDFEECEAIFNTLGEFNHFISLKEEAKKEVIQLTFPWRNELLYFQNSNEKCIKYNSTLLS